ncbi:MAG: chromosomal replication initiator DnaA [Phyllobacteriaceae bacterium]|nr:chromosomal replication initiator DnaA [Phyllobacteriaceae bacterium]
MIDIAAALFNVSGGDLRRTGRCRQDVARVRQIAMYVAHVALGLPQGDIGRGFGRDRTTVLHACHLIEDLRDDAEFDRIVAATERVALAVFAGGAGR